MHSGWRQSVLAPRRRSADTASASTLCRRFIRGSHSRKESSDPQPKGLPGTRVLMPRALDGREEVATLLRRHGAVVDDVPTYRTETRTPSVKNLALLGDGVDAILFTSSSAVSAWCDQTRGGGPFAEVARRAIIACIGPSTASTARDRACAWTWKHPLTPRKVSCLHYVSISRKRVEELDEPT